jgi:glycosyltransferase involved in cell wall biosynthesis
LEPPRSPATARDPAAELSAFGTAMERRGISEVVAIFSFTDLAGEGQRPTELALALAARGTAVVFLYWRWHDAEWQPQDRLDEGILQLPADVIARQPELLTAAFRWCRRIAIFELPWPGFFATLAAANAAGWITLYDAVDDWEDFHRIGLAYWYDKAFERHLIAGCDATVAVSERLAAQLRRLGARQVEVIGNGCRPEDASGGGPCALPRGEVTVGYFGYLSAARLDWDLIVAAARSRPRWLFHLIGWGGPEQLDLPDNVRVLGRQEQRDLATFAACWDVAVVPFKPDRFAASADPLKTYTYLAMGLPVVAAGVHPPAGGERFVERVFDADGFVRAIERAAASERSDAEPRRAFAASCHWERRLDAILDQVNAGRQRVSQKLALFAPA